jgi:hypothetical protein
MTASYPSSVKVFPTHVNVTEVIDAGHPNAIQEEVAAIESTLGATPTLSTSPSAGGTFNNSSTTFSTVSARIANVETGVVSDAHTQYIRKAGDNGNVIQPTDPATTGLVVQGAVSQSANLQEWRDSSGNVVAYIDPTGKFTATNVSGGSGTSGSLVDTLMLMGA